MKYLIEKLNILMQYRCKTKITKNKNKNKRRIYTLLVSLQFIWNCLGSPYLMNYVGINDRLVSR